MGRIWASTSIILTVVFVVVVLAMHLLEPEVDPFVSGISFYALGTYGVLIGLGLASVGVAGIALAAALWRATVSPAVRVGLALLVAWGLSSIAAGLFPLDAPGTSPTLSGTIHGVAGLNFLLIVPAVLLIELAPSRSLAPDQPRRSTVWLAWGILVAAVSLFVFNGPLSSLHVGGAVQRLYWLVLAAWLLARACRARVEGAALADAPGIPSRPAGCGR